MTTSAKLLLRPEYLELVRRDAQRAVQWDGGGPLPPVTPPELVVAMCDEIKHLRAQMQWMEPKKIEINPSADTRSTASGDHRRQHPPPPWQDKDPWPVQKDDDS